MAEYQLYGPSWHEQAMETDKEILVDMLASEGRKNEAFKLAAKDIAALIDAANQYRENQSNHNGLLLDALIVNTREKLKAFGIYPA